MSEIIHKEHILRPSTITFSTFYSLVLLHMFWSNSCEEFLLLFCIFLPHYSVKMPFDSLECAAMCVCVCYLRFLIKELKTMCDIILHLRLCKLLRYISIDFFFVLLLHSNINEFLREAYSWFKVVSIIQQVPDI